MSLRLEFDLRAKKAGGWSGGIVAEDDQGSLSFVSGNSYGYLDQHYVLIDYMDFSLTLDRADFPADHFTKVTSLGQWYTEAMRLLLSKLGPTEFVGVLIKIRADGFRKGAEDAKAQMQKAMGL